MNWLLLRGLARESRHWEQFPELFKQSFPQDKILTIDLPGVGKNHYVNSMTKIDDYVDFVRAQWLEQKNEGPQAIMALSLGAMVAMKWVERYPEDFKYLVTMNTSASNLSNIFERMNITGMKAIVSLFFKNDLSERERAILNLTSNNYKDDETLISKWTNYAYEHPISRKSFVNQLIAASRFKAPKSLPIPTLVLYSAQDRLVNHVCSKRLAKRLDVKEASHPKAGHDLALDAGPWVLEQVKQWLEASKAH